MIDLQTKFEVSSFIRSNGPKIEKNESHDLDPNHLVVVCC